MGKGVRQGQTGIPESQQIGAEDPHCLIRPACAAIGKLTLVGAILSFGSSPSGCPVVRQQLGEPVNGMIGEAGENVFEPDERIDSGALTGSHETPQHRRGLAGFITAKENPVVAAHCYAADRPLGGVVVDLEISLPAVAG